LLKLLFKKARKSFSSLELDRTFDFLRIERLPTARPQTLRRDHKFTFRAAEEVIWGLDADGFGARPKSKYLLALN